jgi:hypothetical protein
MSVKPRTGVDAGPAPAAYPLLVRGVHLARFVGPLGEPALLAVRSDGRLHRHIPIYTPPEMLEATYQRLWLELDETDPVPEAPPAPGAPGGTVLQLI